jgi:hypothetical protein
MVILDFVGNSGRHSLVGPEDLLGGNYSEAEIAEAKKKQSPGGDIRSALEKARLELKRIAGVMVSKVKSKRSEFNPFTCFGINTKKLEETEQRFGYTPASDAQRRVLLGAGVEAKDLSSLSKPAASKLISTIIKRREVGLASYKQLKLLREMGIATPTLLTHRNALDTIRYVDSLRGFTPDPGRVAVLMNGERQPGEDDA